MKQKDIYCPNADYADKLSQNKRILLYAVAILLLTAITGFSIVANAEDKPQPRLYLVSLGTGDPDNITLRALNTIKKSSVIFCMDRVDGQFPGLLDGKEVHKTNVSVHRTFMRKSDKQDEALREVDRISRIVRKAVAEGKTVSVLDYGDPTIYGPNMWFLEAFEDLNPEIITGVSSFNMANAALKKGVTAGENTRSVVLTNGTDVEKLAAARTSMVFFTMHEDVPGIVKKLKNVYPANTPVAVVADAGFRQKEKIIQATLSTIEEKIQKEELSLYLVYVGDFLTKRYGIKPAQTPSGKRN